MTLSVSSLPLRITTTSTVLPTDVSATTRGRSRTSFTSRPSNLTITSPGRTPPLAAGPLSLTPAISAPRARPNPRLSAIWSSIAWMRTPIQPRRVSPNSRSWVTIAATLRAGMAKPMPIEPPDGEMIAVFTPTTSPSMLNKGPPELPRLMAASVCR